MGLRHQHVLYRNRLPLNLTLDERIRRNWLDMVSSRMPNCLWLVGLVRHCLNTQMETLRQSLFWWLLHWWQQDSTRCLSAQVRQVYPRLQNSHKFKFFWSSSCTHRALASGFSVASPNVFPVEKTKLKSDHAPFWRLYINTQSPLKHVFSTNKLIKTSQNTRLEANFY